MEAQLANVLGLNTEIKDQKSGASDNWAVLVLFILEVSYEHLIHLVVQITLGCEVKPHHMLLMILISNFIKYCCY
jgi:hypothetical protein